MLSALSAWIRAHKTLSSLIVIALVAALPVTLAVVHQGFPAEDVDVQSRDVWVTNGDALRIGRLNHQINELDTSVAAASKNLDVLQDGGAYFLADEQNGTLEKIDQAYSTLANRVTIPAGAAVSYGGDTIAVLSQQGKLWLLDASGRLSFDPAKTKPTARLGKHAAVVVSSSGKAFAVSPANGKLVAFDHPGASGSARAFRVASSFQLTAVGDTAVVLDKAGRRIRTADGTAVTLPTKGLRLQQAGEPNDRVVVASGSSLLEVPLKGGEVTTIGSGGSAALTDPSGVSAPVWLNGCAYGAWAGTARYLYACDGKPAQAQHIEQAVTGADLRFRVNHGVIALNNVRTGDVWSVASRMQLVSNWTVTHPDDTETQSQDGQDKPIVQSYIDTLAQRTATDRPPTAVPDTYGIRAGRSTILPVLSNDTDPDGDVLTILDVTPISASQGTLVAIDGGRALQLTPVPELTGGIAFQYTVTDGRGGTSHAQVVATVRPDSENDPPATARASAVSMEVGQRVSYNVLDDWLDPDGDQLTLVSATTSTGDAVSFTPDGTVTYENTTAQSGAKTVTVTVSDGRKSAPGELDVTVKPAGSLDPVATPDFVTAQPGQHVTVSPLQNDRSPSGQPLSLVGAAADEGPSGAILSADADNGTVDFSATTSGTYYVKYTLGAGSKTVPGLIRVDVATAQKDARPIAVTDVAYVRPGKSTTVPVLDNDISPAGRVLVVQSVVKGLDVVSQGINVEVLDNAYVKLTSDSLLPSQVQLTYTVSDGLHSASSAIVVMPAAPLVTHQPPVAVDDTAVVRAGDIVSIPVLDNDVSPDDESFSLVPELADVSQAGKSATAFVSGSLLRYQAPAAPGQYSVSYRITDDYGQTAQATVAIQVTAMNAAKNRAPAPKPLTVRAFAGSALPVTVPLAGIDPDGDSVAFSGIEADPKLGRITATTSTSFTYQAYPGSGGTDEFGYTVVDALGKKATGTVRVGVIPRPETLSPPVAVNDKVEVKPGKTVSIPVLANDSDPNGYPIALVKKLGSVDDGVQASAHGSLVIVRAPQKEGAYLVGYSITNGQGGQASAVIQVTVSDKAKPQYPTAVDHIVDDAHGHDTVTVDARAGAVNPSGLPSDLKVSVSGPEASRAQVHDGAVTVRLGDTRTTLTYGVTDPQTGLTGSAFIVVPRSPVRASKDAAAHDQPTTAPTKTATSKPTDAPKPTPKGTTTPSKEPQPTPTPTKKPPVTTPPPHIKSGLAAQFVDMNGTKTWKLTDLVTVPSGRAAKITGTASAVGGSATGTADQSVTFTAKKDFRGPASITFTVNDGKEEDATGDRTTKLTLDFTVGRADQSDVPPTFTTPPTIKVGAGDAAKTIDLRASTSHPNSKILAAVTYSGLKSPVPTTTLVPKLTGSTLSVSAPTAAKPSTSVIPLTVQVKSGTFTIQGTVNIMVVSSTKAKAVQKLSPSADTVRNKTVTLQAVSSTFWTSPLMPLTITSAKLVNAPSGVKLQNTTTTLTVTVPSGAGIGTASISYTVRDATGDPTRDVPGTATVTIHDVPSAPAAPTIVSSGSGSVTVKFGAATANGKTVTRYDIVARKGGSAVKTVTASAPGTVTVTGLTNGTAYTFVVRGHNSDGDGAYSSASAARTPYGTPGAPGSLSVSSSGYAPATLTASWSAPTITGGGSISYQYKLNSGSWTSTGTSRSVKLSGKGAGTYTFQVRAYNPGSGDYSSPGPSKSISVTDPPPTVSMAKGGPNPYGAPGHLLCIQYSNFKSGTYNLTALYNGDAFSSQGTVSVHLSGDGHYCLTGFVDTAVASWSVAVKITGTLSKTPSVSGSTWNSMASNGWGVG
ncbi:tandem-95 repeat protein [Planctomonas sp. JC2975]|uniref:Ig-like domain-containing protein n=1 Tax=Planctomonas sp. JC2975 TaxID=2729626 RepID=UPI00147585A0|nr:Ig-like domain-containing protein [Planctomonas sp. JC2975]NNC11010.1 tandem-95 repeat protein [Planctomonas sp. JC2975]